MEKFVPFAKQQKKLQRAEYVKRRGTWGSVNPVTRKPANPKAYNRAKTRQDEFSGGTAFR